MAGTHDLWLFVVSGLLLNITPGPDTAYIVARSAQLGFRGGAMAVLGITAGVLVHVSAAALGLSALIAASATAFTIVKYLGAAYLVVIGVTMLLSPSNRTAAAAPRSATAPLPTVFRQGFLTNVLNPKVALFFLAFLPQFIEAGAAHQALAFVFLGLLFDANSLVWNMLVAWLAARAARSIGRTAGLRIWAERGLGTLFVGLGLKLALFERGS